MSLVEYCFQDTLEWGRIAQQGDIPSPRSLCSLVDCGEVLILFGGYARSSMNPINQNVQFFGDLFYFVKRQKKWIQVRLLFNLFEIAFFLRLDLNFLLSRRWLLMELL